MFAKSAARLLGAFLLVVFTLSSSLLVAQTATSGLVSGLISDPSGAVIAGASITLEQRGTNVRTSTVSDGAGHYVFPAVHPSDYSVTFSAKGFQTTVIQSLHVEVQKGYTLNMTLQVGNASTTVEVTDAPIAELQTTSATVGAVLGGVALETLPVFTRSASALMFYQPAVSPGGQISGTRDEQVTFNLDGGDVTSDLEGSNGYASPPGEPPLAPVMPVPIESTQEFQVATTNQNATFGRSSGGQVSLLTKRGTNAFHGSAYEFHNDDGLNANSWTNNHNKLAKPHSVDNRFGFTLGGPILKDKLWFFSNYEGRRRHLASTFNLLVPTPTLQQGILQFRDSANNIVQYPLQAGNITTACGGAPCDPRSIGMSPVVKAQLALYPAGNFAGLGDGLNTTGFLFNAPTPISQNLAVLRLDYKFTDKWNAFVTYHYSKTNRVSTSQLSLLGTPGSVSTDPIYPQYYTFQVTGQLSPNLTAVTHGSFLRNWWGWNRVAPSPLVSGTKTALVLAGEGTGNSNGTDKLLADPVNLATQAARSRVSNGKKWFLAEDLSLLRGNHLFQFGGSWYTNHDFFIKTDNFAGGLASGPLIYVQSTGNSSGAYQSVSSTYQPTKCAGAITTNCLKTSDVLRWNELYSTVLGLVDRSSQVITRDGNFQPYPLGTGAFANATIKAYSLYFQDVWKLRPSLTVTLGMNWGAQPTPKEKEGKYDVLVYANSNTPVDYWGYFANRAASLNNGVLPGQAFNPLFGATPVNNLTGTFKGKIRVTNWHQFGPRAALAWQVPFNNFLFGDKKTVIRAGYGLNYDRLSDISYVSLALTTGGLLDANPCAGPVLQAGKVVCTNAATNPTNAFRIGVDGNDVPVPAATAVPIPYVPSGTATNPFGLFLISGLDPYATPGHSHSIDLTVQRELPGRMVLELGYIGRISKNLPQDIAYNAADYLMKDAASGQTYAQAFDAVAQALRTGAAVPVVPFFENQIGTASCVAKGFTSCSAMVAKQDPTDLVNGSLNRFSLNEFNRVTPVPVDNIQSFQAYGITDHGFSNYNAGFISLNKSLAKGLQFQANWTWSHAIGNQGVDQQNGSSANSPYNRGLDKASESFDRRHVINIWWYYELPFGQGMTASSSALNKVIGGWHLSGIYTFATGVPLRISANGDYGAWESNGTAAICTAPLSTAQHSGVVGSSGIATSGNTGLNIFADPVAIYKSCSRPLLSANDRIPSDRINALSRWNTDLTIGKNIPVTERIRLNLSAEFLNTFNLVNFNNPSLSLNSASSFGVLSSQGNNPRNILLGLRVVF